MTRSEYIAQFSKLAVGDGDGPYGRNQITFTSGDIENMLTDLADDLYSLFFPKWERVTQELADAAKCYHVVIGIEGVPFICKPDELHNYLGLECLKLRKDYNES